jgi:hypothetical protein
MFKISYPFVNIIENQKGLCHTTLPFSSISPGETVKPMVKRNHKRVPKQLPKSGRQLRMEFIVAIACIQETVRRRKF